MIVKFTGDWDKATKFLNNLSNMDKMLLDILEKDIGSFVEVKLKESISSQTLGLAPLNEATVRQKGGTDILLDTKEYVSKLKILNVSNNGGKIQLIVGAGNDNHSSGLTMKELANYIENGTMNQPARPHFRLAWSKIKSETEKKVRESIEKKIRSIL